MNENTAANAQRPDSALKILVCYHKAAVLPNTDDGILLPIHVGKSLSDRDLHIQTDNEADNLPCDNISDKNDTYCELTALYWAWKNLRKVYPDVKYVGLFHYRRFLAFDEKLLFGSQIEKPESSIPNYRVDAEKIIDILERENKIIVPSYLFFFCSEYMHYCLTHISDDIRTLEEVIKSCFPDYYDDFVRVIMKGNKLLSCNMFIMKYDDFAEYCKWLFDVLEVVEGRLNLEHYNTYQKRAPAFMAERLFNVWLRKNHKKLKFYNMYFFDEDENVKSIGIFGKVKYFLYRIASHIKHEITFTFISDFSNIFNR